MNQSDSVNYQSQLPVGWLRKATGCTLPLARQASKDEPAKITLLKYGHTAYCLAETDLDCLHKNKPDGAAVQT